MRVTRWFAGSHRALFGAYRHGALGFAKGAAYSALLAFIPVLTTITTLLIHANAAAVSRKIVSLLFRVAPPGVEEIIRYQVATRGSRPLTVPIAATLLAIWAASGVTTSLMEGFQAAYQRPSRRGVVRQRLLAIWLVIASIVPVVGASSLMLFGDRAQTWVLREIGVLGDEETLKGGVRVISSLIRLVFAFGANASVTAMMFYFGPDISGKRHIWPGAMVSSLLWFICTLAFTWYLQNIAQYNLLYGSIGAVMALLVWMYLLSLSAMVGCEFNAQLDRTVRR